MANKKQRRPRGSDYNIKDIPPELMARILEAVAVRQEDNPNRPVSIREIILDAIEAYLEQTK